MVSSENSLNFKKQLRKSAASENVDRMAKATSQASFGDVLLLK